MPSTTAQKLKIKEGSTLLVLQAPGNFRKDLGELPAGVNITGSAKTFDQLHWFVKDLAELDEERESVFNRLAEGNVCWIYFPKGSSKLKSNLSRDSLWQQLSGSSDLQFLTLISFNDTWSAFALRKTTTGQKKETAPKERPVLQYIDTVKRIVYLPDDFSEALERAQGEKAFFNTLSFTNKKEYVEWIVSAKREETRKTRVQESVSRLAKGWKNPSNR